MFVVLSGLFACQQDLLLLGDVTGIGQSNVVFVLPASEPAPAPTVEVPQEPAPLVVIGAGAAVPEGPPVEARPPAVVPPADGKFNPISIPEGPREGDGVRWEGVKTRGGAPFAPGPAREMDKRQ